MCARMPRHISPSSLLLSTSVYKNLKPFAISESHLTQYLKEQSQRRLEARKECPRTDCKRMCKIL